MPPPPSSANSPSRFKPSRGRSFAVIHIHQASPDAQPREFFRPPLADAQPHQSSCRSPSVSVACRHEFAVRRRSSLTSSSRRYCLALVGISRFVFEFGRLLTLLSIRLFLAGYLLGRISVGV